MGKKSLLEDLLSKITLAVSSTVCFVRVLDERDIREGLGGGSGHAAIMPLQTNKVLHFRFNAGRLNKELWRVI